MFADLPPHSSVQFFSIDAASPITRRPTAVEPVNDILSTMGCLTSSSPAPPPNPGMILTTPGGKPAACTIDASSIAVTGVSSEGLRTTVLPAASAGPSFQTAILRGKFHGMMAPTTPTGSRTTKFRLTPGPGKAASGSGETGGQKARGAGEE